MNDLSPQKKVKTPKNKTPAKSPEEKSVKFLKSKTPLSKKKKFAKASHSPASGAESESPQTPIANKKQRKLFTDANGSSLESPHSKKKQFPKTPHSSKTPHQPLSADDSESPITPIAEMKKRKLFVEEGANSDSDSDSNANTNFSVEEIAEMVKPVIKPAKPVKKLTREEIEKENTENTVFVGNLPIQFNKNDIKKLFSKCGPIVTVRIRCAALIKEARNRKGGTILKQFEPGSSITAFVKFASPNALNAAKKLTGKVVKGHHIRVVVVDRKEKKEDFEKNKSVFIRRLPYDVTEDELWEAFSSCGPIASVRALKDSNYRGRGLGYVNFQKADSVELALKLNGSNIKNKAIIVQRWGTRIDDEDVKKTPKDKKRKFDGEGNEEEFKFSPKKQKKLKGAVTADGDFSGNKAGLKKKNKAKKPSFEGMKKKNLAQILAK